jgi:hypothetical protein
MFSYLRTLSVSVDERLVNKYEPDGWAKIVHGRPQKTYASDGLSTINPVWPDLGSNLGDRGG